MAGILDKLGGALNNPLVQGLLGSAAFGASPLLGLLAGGQINAGRKERSLENDVLREQLRGTRRQNESIEGLQDLVSGSVPTDRILDVDPNDDVLGQSLVGGPRRGITPGGTFPTLQTPAGQRQLPGMLAGVNPQATSAGLLGTMFPQQGRSDPADLRIMDALNLPRTPEGFAQFQELKNTGDPNASLETLIAELELSRLRREEKTEVREERIEVAEFSNNLQSSADALVEMSEINERLAQGGAFTQPGIGAETRGSIAAGGAAIGNLLGIDTSGSEQGAADTQRFKDLSAKLALDRLAVEGFDAGTNARFTAFTNTKPALGSQQGPTDQRIADNIEGILLADSARPGEGFSPERREQLRALVQRLRQSQVADEEVGLREEFGKRSADFVFNPATGKLEPK